MKVFKVILLSLLVSFVSIASLHAQRRKVENLPKYDYKKYHFGFTLGFNQMNFVVTPDKNRQQFDSLMVIEPVAEMGFNIGIVSSLKLYNYLNLRFVPTLSFGDRVLEYTIKYNNTSLFTDKKRVESTYIDLPLTLKYSSKRLTNARAYVLAGARYSIDLASQSKKKADNREVLLKLYENDYSLTLGTGFDFFTNYFKFGVELQMAYGMRNLLKQENNVYASSIDRLNSKIFWLTFTFE
ncbi:MAG: PorT family protein [Saprospiraceae bacterium]|nr:PorT family protein [Saprospiraceae bacterium]